VTIRAKPEMSGTDLTTRRFARTYPEAAVVRRPIEALKHGGRLAGRATTSVHVTGRRFSGPDVEGHTLPAPGIDVKTQGDERLDL
jgi:hypothetical protein